MSALSCNITVILALLHHLSLGYGRCRHQTSTHCHFSWNADRLKRLRKQSHATHIQLSSTAFDNYVNGLLIEKHKHIHVITRTATYQTILLSLLYESHIVMVSTLV